MNEAAGIFLQAFARGERDLSLPAVVPLIADGTAGELQVEAVLRLLPKKRVVVRGRWHERAVVVKWFATDLGGARNVRRELEGYALARAAGVLCPELLAQCESACGRYKGLIFDLIDEARDLSSCWPGFDNAQKKHWLGEIVRSALLLHSGGGYQDDIHLGNFLLKKNRLYTLDLGSVVIKRKDKVLPPALCLANLGQLAAQLDVAEQPLLEELVEWYFEQRHWVDRRAGKEKFLEYTRKAWRARLRDYLHKAMRPCSLTCFEQNWNFLWACRRSWWGDDTQQFLRDPDAYMARGERLKTGNTATVAKCTLQGRPVVIKRYNIKNWRHALGRAWRPTRAYHSWKYAHLLELVGIPSLKPVALLEQRTGPLRGRAYFISEWIDAPDLLSIGNERALGEGELHALKTLLQQMRRCRLSHGDFKANNILVDRGAMALIDLDAMHRHHTLFTFLQAQDSDLRRLQRNWKRVHPIYAQVKTLVRELRARSGTERNFL